MKRNLIYAFAFLAASAAVLSSCEKKVSESSVPSGEKIAVKAYCTPEMKGSERTSLSDPATGTVVWNAGDDIKVFNDLGEASVLTLVSGAGTPNAVFEGEVFKGSGDTYYAVTPSAMQSSFEGGKITFSLPEEQGYFSGSYDSGACPFTATAMLEGSSLNLDFSPAAGLVRFGLRGEGSVTGLTLTDKASGKAYTMTCSAPVALNGSSDTDFYFSVPEGSLSGGFSLEAVNTEGEVAIISTDKDNTVSTGGMKTFGEVEMVFEDYGKCDMDDYTWVTIGSQVWMAENYRCSRYGFQSEAYKNGIYTVPTFTEFSTKAYYVDNTDPSNWQTDEYSGELTPEQISKLGYLYNFGAAVGVSDGTEITSQSYFSERIQGICPDGSHLPSYDEAITFLELVRDDKNFDVIGKKAKTTTGWFNNEDNGTDDYGFNALPAGHFSRSSSEIYSVGMYCRFSVASLFAGFSSYCSCMASWGNFVANGFSKEEGSAVRCIKNRP